MNFRDILNHYVNGGEDHERKAGRYWSSDINQIRHGWLTPENFFEVEEIDEAGQRRITSGKIVELGLCEMFEEAGIEYEHEPKKVLTLKRDDEEIELVVKPDFVFKEALMELKTPSKAYESIPSWYKDQIECEYQAFKKKPFLGVAAFEKKNQFHLYQFDYEPSKERWKEIRDILWGFHATLKKLHD